MQIKYTLLLIILSVFSSACDVSTETVESTPLRLQLKWLHQAQFAGFYLAKSQGLYQSQHYDVSFIPGGPEIVPIEAIKNNTADFAVVSAEDVVRARAEGTPVIAIAAIYRRNPLVFLTHKESELKDPRTFPGHTISYSGQDGKLQMQAMLKNLNLSASQLIEKQYDYSFQNLINGEVDIASAYLTGGYLRLQQKGHEFNIIWPEDFGVHLYGDVLVTHERLLAEKPALVAGFLQASLEGWKKALQDQPLGVAQTMKYAFDANPDYQSRMLAQSLPLIETGEDRIGWMQEVIWNEIINNLVHNGIIERDLLTRPVFDMQPLKSAYRSDR